VFATVKQGAKTVFVMGLATTCALLIGLLGVGNESIIMVFLLSVLFTAVLTSNRGWAIGAALISVMLFNFLFTEPRFSFFIYRTNDLMLIMFFLVTGIVSGTVTSRLQTEMKLASQNERTAKIMYRIASGFLSASGKESVVKKAEDLVREYAGLDCKVYLGQGVGKGFEILSGSGTLGRLILSDKEPEGQQLLIIQAVCTQLGIALERETLVADREKIRLAMVREQQRGTLLRSVAHDLRSPLTALSGAGNLLADNYQELSESERRKLASDISEEIVWLTDLVENILNMTRISEQKIVLHKQDEVIDDVIGEAVKHTERLIRGRSFQVKLPEEVVTAPMDGKLISQVIINLLENAVRHTPPESAITLTVQADEKLIVSVVDTGGGIPAAIRGHLFERFVTQDEEIVDGRRGLGLGLSICKAIIEAHGGEIFVADNVPNGTIFTFTLPMEESHERPADDSCY
jgi:two-component system sensor histidine kinase KdpD